MKIIVFIKNIFRIEEQVSAAGYSHLLVKPDKVICPYDINAVAVAVKSAETTVVAIGGEEVEDSLKYCLAIGAQNAIRIQPRSGEYGHKEQAIMLHNYLQSIEDYLVVFGYSSNLNVINATAAMLSALLECKLIHVTGDINMNPTPAVITVNAPAAPIATFYDIMNVCDKKISKFDVEFEKSCSQSIRYKKLHIGTTCKIFDDITELHGLLQTVAQL